MATSASRMMHRLRRSGFADDAERRCRSRCSRAPKALREPGACHILAHFRCRHRPLFRAFALEDIRCVHHARRYCAATTAASAPHLYITLLQKCFYEGAPAQRAFSSAMRAPPIFLFLMLPATPIINILRHFSLLIKRHTASSHFSIRRDFTPPSFLIIFFAASRPRAPAAPHRQQQAKPPRDGSHEAGADIFADDIRFPRCCADEGALIYYFLIFFLRGRHYIKIPRRYTSFSSHAIATSHADLVNRYTRL